MGGPTWVCTVSRDASPEPSSGAPAPPLQSTRPAPSRAPALSTGAAVGRGAVGHPRGGSGAHDSPRVPARPQARAEAWRRERRRERRWARQWALHPERGGGRRAPRSEPAARCSPSAVGWRWVGDGVAMGWRWVGGGGAARDAARTRVRVRVRVRGQGQWRWQGHASCSRAEIPRRA